MDHSLTSPNLTKDGEFYDASAALAVRKTVFTTPGLLEQLLEIDRTTPTFVTLAGMHHYKDLHAQVPAYISARSVMYPCCDAQLDDLLRNSGGRDRGDSRGSSSSSKRQKTSIGVLGGSVAFGRRCMRAPSKHCSWASMLQVLFDARDEYDVTVHNYATGGILLSNAIDLAEAGKYGCHSIYILAFGPNADFDGQQQDLESSVHKAMEDMEIMLETLSRMPCHPFLIIWDEFPVFHIGTGERLVSFVDAHNRVAMRHGIPHLSLFPAFYEDYVAHQGITRYHGRNPHYDADMYVLVAGILADYLISGSRSAAPQEPIESRHPFANCSRTICGPGRDDRCEGFPVLGKPERDAYGVSIWNVTAGGQFDLPQTAYDMRITYLQSYGSAWGHLSVECDQSRQSFQAAWWTKVSLKTTKPLCPFASALTVFGVKSLFYIYSVSYCVDDPKSP